MRQLLPGLHHWRVRHPEITIDIGIICADETALLLPIDAGILAIGFVPDELLGG